MGKKRGTKSHKVTRAAAAVPRAAKTTAKPGVMVTVPRNPKAGPFPTKMPIRLPYRQTVTLQTASVTGLPGTTIFSTNSLGDPDVSGGGHQPLFHDQLAVIYQKYMVLGVKFRIQFVDTSGKDWKTCVFVSEEGDIYNPASYEFDRTAEKVGCSKAGVFTNEIGKRQINGYIDNTKMRGFGKKRYEAVTHHEANFGSNPTVQYYLTLVAETVDKATSTSITAVVDLVYYGYAYSTKTVAQS